jgi:hypothetical protein
VAKGKPAVPQQDAEPGGNCDGPIVQKAFSLGWHVTELYNYDKLSRTLPNPTSGPARRVPVGQPPLSLPSMGDLKPADRRHILIRQIQLDLGGVWSPEASPPRLEDLRATLTELDKVTDWDDYRARIEKLHEDLLAGLTVSGFRLGKAYGLGRALAETCILPAAAEQMAPKHGAPTDATLAVPRSGQAFRQQLEHELASGRVATVQGWVYDLRDCFPKYAADATARTLAGWAVWMVRPSVDGDAVRWSNDRTRERIQQHLRRQGDVWRGMLSGEKDPVNMLDSDAYFNAIRSMLARVAKLALRFLGSGLGLLLLLLLIVTSVALYFALFGGRSSTATPAVIAFLGSIGITAGSAWAAVQKALAKAEEPLWSAEVSAAVAEAAWHNPAPLASIEELDLLIVLTTPDDGVETRLRHPRLTALRKLPVGGLGIVLIVTGTAITIGAVWAGRLQLDAAFFIPPLIIVGFLAAIDAWDLLIGLAARRTAPYLALPDRITLPDWLAPVGQGLAPILFVGGLLAGHFFWH